MERSGTKLVRGDSKWKRKSLRRSETDTAAKPDKRKSAAPSVRSDKERQRVSTDEVQDVPGPLMMQHNWSSSQVSISVVPDRLQELPAWYNHELERTAAATVAFRKRYPVHNPIGPRVYRNCHLIPPHRRQGTRPSSNFSPHFPPISASTGDHSMHTMSMPGPSRTPSGSPLPTPSSSQVRLNEIGVTAAKPRTRKMSQGAPHDNVDMMDVSDPWGTNWHHQSPYDVGIRPENQQSPTAASPSAESPESSPGDPRPRLSSVPMRSKTVKPSPLSQSTSAIHLQAPPVEGHVVLRKLSKRRKTSPFLSSDGPDTISAPATPISPSPAPEPPRSQSRVETRPKNRISLRPSASTTSVPTLANSMLSPDVSKKEKRGSFLGRFVRRFSIMRKPTTPVSSHPPSSWVPPPQLEPPPSTTVLADVPLIQEPEEIVSEMDRMTVHNDAPAPVHLDSIEQDPAKRDSMSIMEAPYSMGHLSITNPDAPTPDAATPLRLPEIVLPQQQDELIPPPVTMPAAEPEPQPRASYDEKNLPMQPAPSVMSPMSRKSSLPSIASIPPPIQVVSPAFSATAPTIPSPSELAYVSMSPTMPAQDEMPSIPSPTSTAAPLPPPRDYRDSRMSISFPTSERAPWTVPSNDSALSRSSIVAHPPTPQAVPEPALPRLPSPTRKPVVYTEVDMFASAAASRQQSESPNKSRDPSPAKSHVHHQDLGISPTTPNDPIFMSRESYTTALGGASREGSPTKMNSGRDRSGSPVKGPRSRSRPPSQGRVHQQSPREVTSTQGHFEQDRIPSPTKASRTHNRDSSSTKADHEREKHKDSERSTVRRTETFRLVRSHSGGVVHSLANPETIVANGEQWEVVVEPVLAPKKSRKDRSSKDLVEDSRRESRRDSRRKEKERAASEEPELTAVAARRESRRREHASEHEDRRASKREHKHREKHRSHGEAELKSAITPITTSHVVDNRFSEASVHTNVTDADKRVRSERRPSGSIRPTSELANEADSPLRARDAYELERMWRGRSVALDSNIITTPPPTQMPLPSLNGATTHMFGPASHGSSHTGYMMSTPFGPPPPQPQPVPTAMYIPAQPRVSPPPVIPPRSSARTSMRASSASPTKLSAVSHVATVATNPLPEPPRPSLYTSKSVRTPQVIEPHAGTPGSREYWAKYAGLTPS